MRPQSGRCRRGDGGGNLVATMLHPRDERADDDEERRGSWMTYSFAARCPLTEVADGGQPVDDMFTDGEGGRMTTPVASHRDRHGGADSWCTREPSSLSGPADAVERHEERRDMAERGDAGTD